MRNIRQHEREKQDPEVRLAFERHKEREAAEGTDQRAGDIDAASTEAVRQPGEAGDGQATDGADEQANIQEQLARQTEVLRRIVERKSGDDIHGQQFAQTQTDNH